MIERVAVLTAVLLAGLTAIKVYKAWVFMRVERTQRLRDFMEGRPAVVLFTADFCQPCKQRQQPAIQRLAQEIGEEHVQVITIDVQEAPEIARIWGVLSLPTTFILDDKGKPRDINYGVTSTEKLKRQLDAIA